MKLCLSGFYKWTKQQSTKACRSPQESLNEWRDKWQEWKNSDVKTRQKRFRILKECVACRGDRTKDRKWNGNGQERKKKPEVKCAVWYRLGYYPFTLPLEVYGVYQPMSKRRKWTKEVCAKPLVKRSPSCCLVSIFTREIFWEGSATLSRNQWYLMA